MNNIAMMSKYLPSSMNYKEETLEDKKDLLMDRDKRFLKRMAEGYTQKESADFLNICAKALVTHQTNITKEVGIRTRTDLIKFAIQKGITKTNGVT